MTPSKAVSLLKQLQGQEKKLFNIALAAGVVSALAIITQAALLAQIISQLVLAQTFTIQPVIYLTLTMLVRALSGWVKDMACMKGATNIRSRLRTRLTHHLAELGPARRLIDQDGSLSTTVYEQVDALDDYFSRYQVQTWLCIIIPVTILISVARFSWLAAAIFLTTAPLVVYFMILVGQKAASANRRLFNQLALLSNQFLDLSRGMAQLKLLGRTEQARDRLEGSAEAYRSSTMKVLQLAFLSTATLELFSSISIALTALLLGLGLLQLLPWMTGETYLHLQASLFILILAPEFYLPLRQLGSDYHAKQKAVAAAEQILKILETKLINSSSPHAETTTKPCPAENTTFSAQPAPAIEFNDVHWQIDGRSLLNHINLQIAAGERVWIYGESGAGKSSLLNLLLGFNADYSGQIKIGTETLNSHNASSWRRQLAWIPQRPEWVTGTLGQNLALGLSNISREQMDDALRRADALEFVELLPLGLDTSISELGSGLSGGQLQRLSIARAVLTDASVWLLDEPCAHLDAESAEAIYTTLESVTHGKTTLLISHDTHPIEWADNSIMIKHGEVYQQQIAEPAASNE